MFVRAKLPLAVFALTALVAGCEGQFGSKDEDAGASQPAAVVESTPSSSDSSSASTTTGIGTESGFQGHPLDDPASPLAKRTVYFEFDSSEMKEEDRYILEAHAGYLAGNSQATVTLEGHADERGTRGVQHRTG